MWNNCGKILAEKRKVLREKTHLVIYLPSSSDRGKGTVPLQPMKVAKGDQNGYHVSGGIAGAPCPKDYKHGGVALQVGSWATGRQIITVEKAKLWPQNRLSGIDVGSGRGYEITLGV